MRQAAKKLSERRSRQEDWELVPLGSLAEFRNGVNFTKESFGMGIKVINVKDFQDRFRPDYGDLGEINPEGVIRDADLLHEGDIVFVRSNGNRQLIGRSLFITKAADPVTHSAFTIRARLSGTGVFPLFYAYVLRSHIVRQALSAYGGGTNINNLNQTILASLPVPKPPLEVQHRIASTLSAYDELIENNTRRIKILEEVAQALYREWFVHFRFPGHGRVKLSDSSFSKIPEGWEVTLLRDIASYIGRGVSPRYSVNSDQYVINQKCIRDQKLTLTLARRHSTNVPEQKRVMFGDVLINSTGVGTLGRVAQVYEPLTNYTVDSHVSIVRPRESVSMDYFGLSLLGFQSHFDRLGFGATGQTELSRDSIANTELLVPPQSIQSTFSELVSPMRKNIAVLSATNGSLRHTRDLLLPRLISGEIEAA